MGILRVGNERVIIALVYIEFDNQLKVKQIVKIKKWLANCQPFW
jgi:hypothetical protein